MPLPLEHDAANQEQERSRARRGGDARGLGRAHRCGLRRLLLRLDRRRRRRREVERRGGGEEVACQCRELGLVGRAVLREACRNEGVDLLHGRNRSRAERENRAPGNFDGHVYDKGLIRYGGGGCQEDGLARRRRHKYLIQVGRGHGSKPVVVGSRGNVRSRDRVCNGEWRSRNIRCVP